MLSEQVLKPSLSEFANNCGAGSNGAIGKILVVDDEPELRTALVEALVAQGYETLSCSSGQKALEELRAHNCDLLLTDLMMPEIDGISLIKAALEIDPHLVAIVMTGQGTIQTAVDAMKVGAFDYVLKPFRLQMLMPVLTRAINTRRLRMENLQLRETVAIYSLCQTIAFTLDAQTVLSRLADAALQQSDADEVSILLPTIDGTELYVAAVRGEKRERLLGERIPLQDSISSWVARERTPLILTGEVHDERFVALWPRPEIRSAVSIPMQVASKLVGIINLNVTNRLRPFTLGQMKALSILASTAAAALESASLYTQVDQAEKNYRSIFENAVEGIFQSTADRRFLTVNPALANILEYDSPEEVVASFTDIGKQLYVDPACPEQVTQTLKERGVLQGFEFEAYRKDREKIWLSLNIRVVRDETGAEICREGTIEDITERKRAEAERLVIFEIIQGVITTRNLDELLNLIHNSISEIIPAENCYVALYDKKTGLLHLPLCRDKYDPIASSMKLGKGLTAYVFREGYSMLMTQPAIRQLIAKGDVELVGTLPAVWLGVPLKTATETVGVLVVQHYEDSQAYSQRDIEFLTSVGGQIALAIERKRGEEALQETVRSKAESLALLDTILSTAPIGFAFHSRDLAYQRINESLAAINGLPVEQHLGKTLREVLPDMSVVLEPLLQRVIDTGEPILDLEISGETPADLSHQHHWLVSFYPVRMQGGELLGVGVLVSEITERKRAEEELRESEERYRLLFESNPQPMWVYDLETLAFLAVNESAVQHYGYSRDDFLAMTIKDIRPVEDLPALYDSVARHTDGVDAAGVWRHRKKDGTIIEVEITSHLLVFDDRRAELILANDITERNRLKAALLTSEDQLRQSQKLEAIGQLAGGVAHDFNNLLTAINGYSSLALQRLDDNHPIKGYLEEIKKAGDRAANLTRQLLAFGRKQMLQPLALNLNDVVADMNKMLRRLIGEDIKLTAKFDPALKKTKADPGQIEQVLVNLVVNARDAMPKGGNLTIETANTDVDREYASKHFGVKPGSYVMLAVSDTGTGMDEGTKARIFEPFFTTKEKGKGTGLGLSTVYGIVKQSGGNIWVYSEPGRGTSFKVYLPQFEAATKPTEKPTLEAAAPGGSETILLVEDEDVVRGLARKILEQAGYKVLDARGGEEALRLCQGHTEPIHLLLTDVVMPETSGKEIAERLTILRPATRVLFMSGYTDEAIVHHGILDSNVEFIQKPFTPIALAKRVREVLDLKSGGNGKS